MLEKIRKFQDDENFESSRSGYNFMIDFIKFAPMMNEEELNNWQKIKLKLKENPNFIKDYLKLLELELESECILA